MRINKDLLQIEKENAFSRTTEKVKIYREKHPDASIISLGIGDVSFPVVKPIVEAMKKAVEEQGDIRTFTGYGSYFGIKELREAIAENDYAGLPVNADEIYVGCGTKTDSTALLELFDKDVRILTGDPNYPIYHNGALALNRKVISLPLNETFKMDAPKEDYDILYLCCPNNPIGNVYTREELKDFVEDANRKKAVILYDNVYKDFISEGNVPGSIYEIEGAKNCCIEMRSFSKTSSFSGIRCSYFVLPKEFGKEIRELWRERTINRFNGADIIAQKGALAVYTKEAQELISSNIAAYKENTAYLKASFEACGYEVLGGENAPYMFVKAKEMSSWEAFDLFLEEMQIIVIPGIIFGRNGDGWFRVSGLGTKENSILAMDRLRKYEETH